MKDTVTEDALLILKDRFRYFREAALTEAECDFLIVDSMKNRAENIYRGYPLTETVKTQLEKLRRQVVDERNKESKNKLQ